VKQEVKKKDENPTNKGEKEEEEE
jgi:hypothetical protein